jgi:hypothetical protein
MKKLTVMAAMILMALAVSGQAFSQGAPKVEDLSKLESNAPPMLGIHWARGADPFYRVRESRSSGGGKPPRGSSPNMTYHGGVIMPTAVTQSIFWGPSWGSSPDEISGLDSWYVGFDGSHYAETSDEYTGSNGQVGPSTTPLGHLIDASAAASGGNTSAILSEVCKEIGMPVANGYYAVYVDLQRKHASYCAYHSVGFCPQ